MPWPMPCEGLAARLAAAFGGKSMDSIEKNATQSAPVKDFLILLQTETSAAHLFASKSKTWQIL